MRVQEEEENMGDVDLWSLTPDGQSLTVNAKWLQHLQDRLLGEDSHPRKVCTPTCSMPHLIAHHCPPDGISSLKCLTHMLGA